MKVKTALAVIAVAAVFSLVAFAVPFMRNEGFWLAYGFGMIAIAAQLYFFQSAFFRPGTSAKSRVYGFPVARIGVIYLVVQFVVSVGEMLLAGQVPLWVYLVLNGAILAFVLVGGLAVETARGEVEKQDARGRADTSSMQKLRIEAEGLLSRCDDAALRQELSQLATALRFSDPVSCEATVLLEGGLAADMLTLRFAVVTGNIASASIVTQRMLANLKERNNLCRLSK